MRGDGRVFKKAGTHFWWAKFYVDGQPVYESTRQTEEGAARKILRARVRKLHTAQDTGAVFESVKVRKTTVGALLDGLEADLRLRGKDSRQNLSHIKKAREYFGDQRACQIDAALVDKHIAERLEAGDAKGTVNRALQVLGQSFTLAVRQGTLSRAPYIRKLSEKGNERKVSVSEKQLADFLAALPDDGLRDFAEWCAVCGMRRGEASELTWNMIHGDRLEVPGSLCKNKEPHILPLTGALAAIIERRRKARQMDCQYLFHREGRKINDYRKSVATARKKANLPAGPTRQERFVFHSLRSVAVTNLIHAGIYPEVAMKISGHKTQSMLARYSIFTTDDLRDALTQTESYRREQAAKPVRVVAMGARG